MNTIETAIFWVLAQTGWTPAIISSAVTGFLVLILNTYLKGKIENKFQQRIEAVKSSFRIEEEKIKIRMKARDDEIASLRSNALSRLAGQQGDIDKRRIAAAEKLWSAVIDESKLMGAASLFAHIKMEVMLKVAASGGVDAKRMQEGADIFLKMANCDNIHVDLTIDKERPFLTPISWSLFSAYRVILRYPVALMQSVKIGMDGIIDMKSLSDTVKAVFPDRNYSFDNYNIVLIPMIAKEIQERILEEIRSGIYQPFPDENSTSQAHAIISATEAATIVMNKANSREDVEAFAEDSVSSEIYRK